MPQRKLFLKALGRGSDPLLQGTSGKHKPPFQACATAKKAFHAAEGPLVSVHLDVSLLCKFCDGSGQVELRKVVRNYGETVETAKSFQKLMFLPPINKPGEPSDGFPQFAM